MKKLAIILALLLVPMTAFGMDTISDTDLDAVTGQAGVSIALTSICIQNSSGTTSYGDADQTKWLSIVQVGTRTRTIGFHAKYRGTFDTLTIDVVNLQNVKGWNLRRLVVPTDLPVANSGVKITLPDIIQIEEDSGLTRRILVSDTANAVGAVLNDEIIRIYSAAGTTRIVGADMGTAHSMLTIGAGTLNAAAVYFSGENTTIMIGAH
jgi:hypothetical protein